MYLKRNRPVMSVSNHFEEKLPEMLAPNQINQENKNGQKLQKRR